ncbi:MAG TPA: hypothetical protein PLK40_01145, partial [Bacteroidaceae bacterium]|nr:hypothetical protein [Bacteroidaceae bacterium]
PFFSEAFEICISEASFFCLIHRGAIMYLSTKIDANYSEHDSSGNAYELWKIDNEVCLFDA